MNEFDLIKTYFDWSNPPNTVSIGVGDDAAIVQVPSGEDLLISVDTFISGVHFPSNTPADAIGYKALAVNLSDLAAMGATPRWFTLALTLPEVNRLWLQAFAQGLKTLAAAHGIFLIGGDTTRGALSITIQVMGTAPKQQALLRSGAQAGDLLLASGYLGDAAAGLALVQGRLNLPAWASDYCIKRLNYPSPRTRLGTWLVDKASSCMDISDGLLGDLKHILQRSQVGAKLNTQQFRWSKALALLPMEQRLAYALGGGDDYELLFTVPPVLWARWKSELLAYSDVQVLGCITNQVECIEFDQTPSKSIKGYDHFDN